jgi:uncharacterized membrane protein
MGIDRSVVKGSPDAMPEAQPSAETARKSGMFKTTVIGGLLFLLPIILIVFLLGKALGFARRLSEPVIQAAGVSSIAGIATGTIVAVLVLILISFAAGLLARTRFGQTTFSRMESSILGVLPQWRMARGFIQSFETETRSEVDVVLVPTDAGWCLGFVLEKPEGDWWTVFIPGAPQWTSGAVSFAHSDQVQQTGLTPAQAIMLMRRCGAGSANIRALLASLQEQDAL